MNHTAPRHRKSHAGSRRLVLAAVALLGAVTVLMGGQGSFAFWTAEVVGESASLSSGRFEITLDGTSGTADDPLVLDDLALDAMVPGESVARTVQVANAGDAPMTWVAGVQKSGALAPALAVELRRGAKAENSGTAYPRTGSCVGGESVQAGQASPRLDAGDTHRLCIRVALPVGTGNEFRGKAGSAVAVRLHATQVTS